MLASALAGYADAEMPALPIFPLFLFPLIPFSFYQFFAFSFFELPLLFCLEHDVDEAENTTRSVPPLVLALHACQVGWI